MTTTVRDAEWRDLPRLAWVLGCAYGAGPAWVRRAGALVLAVALGAPAVVTGRLRGRVLHVGGRAVVLVEEPMGPVRRVATLAVATLVALPGILCLTVVVALGTVVLPAPVATLVTVLVLVCPVVPLVWSAFRSRRQGRGIGWARRAGLVPADAAVVGMLGAWPQGRGHGRALLHGLAGALDSYRYPVVAAARTVSLASWYSEAAGLTPIAPGSLVLIRHPSRATP